MQVAIGSGWWWEWEENGPGTILMKYLPLTVWWANPQEKKYIFLFLTTQGRKKGEK